MDSNQSKKKKKKTSPQNELIQIRIDVAKAGSKKYTHVDWEELLRKHGHERDEDALRRFYDEDTLFMAKKLGETKSKSGKQLRVALDHIQYLNRNCGFDLDDDFIDDTEAVDDLNFVSKKGGFYVGKGDVKTMDEQEDEEEEESDEEEVEVQKKAPAKKKTSKPTTSSNTAEEESSDSEEEPVRMTGAPPMARMSGAPPSKRLLTKRPSPPVSRRDTSPVTTTVTTSQIQKKNIPVVEIDEEPPAKRKPAESLIPTTSAENSKKKADEKTSTSVPESSTPVKESTNVTVVLTNLFTALNNKGKIYQQKNLKILDKETLDEVNQLIKIAKHHKLEKVNMDSLLASLSNAFGIPTIDLKKQIDGEPLGKTVRDTPNLTLVKKEPETEWKLTSRDIPSLTDSELAILTTVVKSWKSRKIVADSVVNKWICEVNSAKLNADQARTKFFECVIQLPEKEKTTNSADSGSDLPKHERSRKARSFLHQWVYLSRKYIETLIPTLKKPSTEGLAKKQLIAANAIRDGLHKQMASFELKKDKTSDAIYQFQFTEPVMASVWTYLDELTDYSLAVGKLEVVVSGIDSLHQALEGKLPLIQFYIEICRRLQKLSFLTAEEPMRSKLAEGNEKITKHQVVQNPKYMIKWPGGVEPSIRGINTELLNFEPSVLSKATPSKTPSKPVEKPPAPTPPTTKSTVTPLATRQPTDDERRAMNPIVQIYLGKYLLANAGKSTADICDAAVVPIPDDLLVAIITAVYVCGVPLMNQMVMLKNLLSHVGQTRMAQAIASHKAANRMKLTTIEYQAIFEYFSKYENAIETKKKEADEKAKREKERQAEKERLKLEEKLKKEKERQEERDRKEKERIEEKERKERERLAEKERKEREAREERERRRREEEDRLMAQAMIRKMEEERQRKREAEEAELKELERKRRMETEAAAALQELEEDNLMDDMDFLTEQQTREDEERKNAEARRAVDRENQIKMMRAQQIQKADTLPTSSGVVQVKSEILETSEKPKGAFDKLEMLRGRTMSADVKRLSEGAPQLIKPVPQFAANSGNGVIQNQNQNQNQMTSNNVNMFNFNQTPLSAPSTSQQQFFGDAHRMVPNPMTSSAGIFFNNGDMTEQREPNRRSMSMSQMAPNQPVPVPPHIPQQQQQHFPIPTYQSPVHQMSNSTSSLMHTPLSNGSMVPQSPQFPSHPSPMSQQFHTPPSVGMSPMAPNTPQQQHLQHLNNYPQIVQNPNFQQQQQQQRLQMQRQMNMNLQQQQNLMMRHHQFPPH